MLQLSGMSLALISAQQGFASQVAHAGRAAQARPLETLQVPETLPEQDSCLLSSFICLRVVSAKVRLLCVHLHCA